MAGPVRVVNVVYDPRFGGPQYRVLQVALRLRDHGVETVVVFPASGPDDFARVLDDAGVRNRRIALPRIRGPRRVGANLRWLAGFWPSVRSLRRLLEREGAHLVHTNGIRHLQSALAARGAGLPLLWHLNDVDTPRPVTRLARPVLDRYASAIAVAAKAVARHYFGGEEHPRVPTHVLYAPVECARFADIPTADRAPSPDFPLKGGPVIGTIGNLNPFKGHGDLIDAAALVVERFPDAAFAIAGAELANRRGYARSLRRRVREAGLEERIHFLGRVNDIPGFLASLDLYVHPSLAEACPMAVLEAMAAGRPVVATDVGGVGELVPDGEAGVVVPAGEPEALADAMKRLLSDPGRARRLAGAARARAQEKFDISYCVERHHLIYRAMLAESSHVQEGRRARTR